MKKRYRVCANKRSVRSSHPIRGKQRITAAKLLCDVSDYEPWSGAKDTWKRLEEYDKIDALWNYLDEAYYDEGLGEGIITDTALNDLLWFEPETVYEAVGLYYDPEEDEVSDTPFEKDDEEEY